MNQLYKMILIHVLGLSGIINAMGVISKKEITLLAADGVTVVLCVQDWNMLKNNCSGSIREMMNEGNGEVSLPGLTKEEIAVLLNCLRWMGEHTNEGEEIENCNAPHNAGCHKGGVPGFWGSFAARARECAAHNPSVWYYVAKHWEEWQKFRKESEMDIVHKRLFMSVLERKANDSDIPKWQRDAARMALEDVEINRRLALAENHYCNSVLLKNRNFREYNILIKVADYLGIECILGNLDFILEGTAELFYTQEETLLERIVDQESLECMRRAEQNFLRELLSLPCIVVQKHSNFSCKILLYAAGKGYVELLQDLLGADF